MCKEGFFGDGRDSCEGMCIRNSEENLKRDSSLGTKRHDRFPPIAKID